MFHKNSFKDIRRSHVVRLPGICANIESESVDARSRGELNVILEVFSGIGVCVAHHKMGNNVFLRIVSFCLHGRTVSKRRMRSSTGKRESICDG